MQSFSRLARAIAPATPPVTLLGLLRNAASDLLSFINGPPQQKADLNLIEPLRNGLQRVTDASKARTSYQANLIQQARSSFLRARTLGPSINSAQLDVYAGVCADLLAERSTAVADYEAGYSKCMAIDLELWSIGMKIRPGDELDWGTFENVFCSVSRRSILAVYLRLLTGIPAKTTATPISCWDGTNDFCAGMTQTSNVGLQLVEIRTRGFNVLYPVMRPIADLLSRRKSRLKGLVPSSVLRPDNLSYGAQVIRRMTDRSCRGELGYWH